ncbi:hypothetical protein ARALYDRAFT_661552 [Arabidopsis lyrata subsp. lyrata]|uniref:Cystatin domain-containing protein n=1 Tax=Arabidopsis lyrata subsp. lyrata TaxID=81972 RepID=D7LWX1_ARALL|nr:uncharacterized protein LOC9307818 isoform X2 [Arabidopsis lyrata subsp. lyrata]EFH50070.1 hypothetical protein ARALYDRAFT_661552 [Arabidopsis lyrata subsp. lyrata]|eukprot:XP_002873811.1 uncharacterized protein LOC9307818 isoform X2 [Arabidopsis lyrata subsp. lyrata]
MTSANNELTCSTTGTSAKEEEVVSKVDKEDDESSSDSDGSDSEWAGYNWLPETEPEWDVDSFDGHEFKINPRVRKMYSSQELYDKYYNNRLKAFESKGFLPDHLNGIYNVYLDEKMDGYNTTRDFMVKLANVCVKKHNETKGTTLELVNVVRATERGAATWRFYITFMAQEYRDGPLVEYQAKVIKFLGDKVPFPVLCRPSPKPEI